MSTNEGAVQQPVEATESKKEKGVSKATAHRQVQATSGETFGLF